jgi:hypothetical protein
MFFDIIRAFRPSFTFLKHPCVQRDTVYARGTPDYNALKQASLSFFLRPSCILPISFLYPSYTRNDDMLCGIYCDCSRSVTLPDKSEAETVILAVSMSPLSRAAV